MIEPFALGRKAGTGGIRDTKCALKGSRACILLRGIRFLLPGVLSMARAFWTGHIQISLVSFGIELFPATEAKGEIHFHQISRKTGERVRHQKVAENDAPVEREDIVKGYEYSKGQYVAIEPEDIDKVRIPSRQTLEITQFVDLKEIDPQYFEKPYFVVPSSSAPVDAFAVIRQALRKTGKAGLGKIAFGGREHVMAITAPEDAGQRGIMAYVLRYSEELRDGSQYFANIKDVKIDPDQLHLAEELIQRRSSSFDASKFTDEYESALRAMVEAKIKDLPQAEAAPEVKSGKVINLMDALRKSIGDDPEAGRKKPAARGAKPPARVSVLKPAKGKPTARKRTA